MKLSTPSPLAPTTQPEMAALGGVQLAVAKAGIKYQDRLDVLLMHFDEGTQMAGVFTKSQTPAAPIDWCKTHLHRALPRALVVNSGNANAFTGARGIETVQQTAAATAKALNVQPEQVMLSSTGVIGEPLPAEKITGVLPGLTQSLGHTSWLQAAKAIMTTDTFAKCATTQVVLDGVEITLHGIAKGSGMIAPDMATMLGFLATDAAIDAPLLQAMLARATEKSFNAITVDSDMSTSDCCLLFATQKAAMNPITDANDPRLPVLEAALQQVMVDLAKQIVRDGEGAQKFFTVRVKGAKSDQAAKRIGLSIANSPLVKTAIAGEDANWGRIVMAVGKSGEAVDRDALSIAIGGVVIAEKGERVASYDEAPVTAHMKGQDIEIDVNIHLGSGEAEIYSCDLTSGYIAINADYRS